MAFTTRAADGSVYTQYINQAANESLNISFIAPQQEVTEMINRRKEAKAISLHPEEANHNLSNTSFGAIATHEGCDALKRKQEDKAAENAAKVQRKENKFKNRVLQDVERHRLKQIAMKYFMDNNDDKIRTIYCNSKSKKLVDEHILAFDGKVKDDKKKTIPIAQLKVEMKNLIINAINNNEYDDEMIEYDDNNEMIEDVEENGDERIEEDEDEEET